MNSLMQQHNSQYSPESSISVQRPPNIPSKNLTQNELQCLYDLLGPNCVTLATAVAQILYGCDNVWQKHVCGVLCYVKDYTKRIYCFRLYDLRSKKILFEELTLPSLRLEKSIDLFYTFDGVKDKIGINFVDQYEAETFCKNFHEKQQNRHKKMTNSTSTNAQQQTSISTLTNGFKPPSNDSIKTPISLPISDKKIKSKPAEHGKNKRNRPVTISGPIRASFVHLMHIGNEKNFVIDETHKQLFEQVLINMHMTPEEEIYIRRTVKDTDDGLEKLFTKSKFHNDISIDQPPAIPPRTYAPLQPNNPNPIPFQDISMPTLTYNQTNKNPPQPQNTSIESEKAIPPVVPPRPAPRVLNTTPQSIKTSRAPPPPVPPTELQNLVIPPPPLPPPAPTFLIEETTNQAPIVSSNSEHNSFLKEICNFDTVKLKSASERPTTMKTSENKSNIEVQKTLEENIRDLLKKRREDLMGRENEENENDSSDDDDEWCD